MYYAATYTLRGKARTDSLGRLEVLTVRPGEYGGRNVGHIHAILSGNSGGRFRTLTTQCYVCPGNEAKYMERDMCVRSESALRSDHWNADWGARGPSLQADMVAAVPG